MGAVHRVGAFASSHALALLIALGAVVRFATLGDQAFWLDEHVTVNLVQESPIDLLKTVIDTESNPSFYYLATGGWERIFGAGEFGIRSISALAGVLAIPLMFGAVREFAGRAAGLIAAALTAASPLLIWYSQEARNYEFLVLLSALGLFCFAKALDESGHRWLWGWALASSLALATHYFAFFAILPQAAWLLWRRPTPRLDTALPMGAIVITGLALLPLVAEQRGRGSWIAGYSFSGRFWNVPEHFAVGYNVPWGALPWVAVGVIAAVAVYGATAGDARHRTGLLVTGSLALGGLALVGFSAAVGDDYLLTRNLLELWPAAAAALAIAFAAPRARVPGIAATVALCTLGIGLTIWSAATPETQRADYEELAEALGPADTDRLIVSQSGFSSPLTLYLDDTRTATEEELATSELVVVEQRPATSYAVGTCVWLPTCGGEDVEPPPRFEPPAGFELERRAQTDGFDYAVYRAAEPVPIERPLELFTPRVFIQQPPGGTG